MSSLRSDLEPASTSGSLEDGSERAAVGDRRVALPQRGQRSGMVLLGSLDEAAPLELHLELVRPGRERPGIGVGPRQEEPRHLLGEDGRQRLAQSIPALEVPLGLRIEHALRPVGDARRALVERFHAAGITDVSIIYRGVYAGRISLGAYNGPRSADERRVELAARAAERRREAIAELGFEAEVQPFTRSQRTWRLDLGLPPGLAPEVVRTALSNEAGSAALESGPCEALMAAAQ